MEKRSVIQVNILELPKLKYEQARCCSSSRPWGALGFDHFCLPDLSSAAPHWNELRKMTGSSFEMIADSAAFPWNVLPNPFRTLGGGVDGQLPPNDMHTIVIYSHWGSLCTEVFVIVKY